MFCYKAPDWTIAFCILLPSISPDADSIFALASADKMTKKEYKVLGAWTEVSAKVKSALRRYETVPFFFQ